MQPDSVGVANSSCSLRVSIYEVRGRTHLGEFLTLAAKLKKINRKMARELASIGMLSH